MTTTWHYDVGLVLDGNGQPLASAAGQFRLATADGPGNVVQALDTSGSPLAAIRTSTFGLFSRFNVTAGDDQATGYLDFGSVIQPVVSIEAQNSLPLARAAAAAAAQASVTATQALTDLRAYVTANPTVGGSGGTGSTTSPGIASVTLANVPAGYTHSIAYSAAMGVTARSQVTGRFDVVIRVYGGAETAPDPSWMLIGVDYRDDLTADPITYVRG